ncbi:MAG TPA: hypothetical protein VK174_11960, partial [Chitinophagales bacterium]|nr:hypothetical protein [Chitinophagales bacterium]
MKKLLYIFLSLLVVLLLVAIICFKPLDNTPYQQTEFYKQQLAVIDSAVQFRHPKSSTQNL